VFRASKFFGKGSSCVVYNPSVVSIKGMSTTALTRGALSGRAKGRAMHMMRGKEHIICTPFLDLSRYTILGLDYESRLLYMAALWFTVDR
jgi:hypothetical protein